MATRVLLNGYYESRKIRTLGTTVKDWGYRTVQGFFMEDAPDRFSFQWFRHLERSVVDKMFIPRPRNHAVLQMSFRNIYTTLNPDTHFAYRYTHTDAFVFINGHIVCHVIFVENSSVSAVFTTLFKNKESMLRLYFTLTSQLSNIFNLAVATDVFEDVHAKNDPSLFATG